MNHHLTKLSKKNARCFSLPTIRAIDNAALTELGLPLMETAGRAAAELLIEQYPNAEKFAVFAGSGNNGGDAWVCARYLILFGKEVSTFYTALPKGIDATAAWEKLLEIAKIHPEKLDALPNLASFDCVVDGLLGSGLQNNINEKTQGIIEHINNANLPCLSLDIPSGLNAANGYSQPIAIQATLTLTFVGLKIGLLQNDGRDVCGEIFFNSLDIPEHIFARFKPNMLLATRLPAIPRKHNSHKGCYGRINIVGGQPSMVGAVILAAKSALRCGAGLVVVTTHEKHASFLSTALPEAIFDNKICKRANVHLIGPGLGQTDWSHALFNSVIENAIKQNHPILIDACGLQLLAKSPFRYDHWVLTPHPGEAASLLDTSIAAIEANRLQAAKAIAEKYGGIVVLKGSASIIANATEVRMCPYGNPAMASAGMGDVLAGIIAGLIGQGIGLFHAAQQGVTVHALTADALQSKRGWGLQPTDIVEALFIHQ